MIRQSLLKQQTSSLVSLRLTLESPIVLFEMKEDGGGEHQGLSSGPSYRRDDVATPAFCPEYLERSSSAC